MSFINSVLGVPLGYLLYFIYWLIGNFGLAIISFAIIVKIPLFPIMMMAHKNSIRLLQLQPALNIIKQRFTNDKEAINEAQYELFKKEKYSPIMGIMPLFFQLFLVMGILQVMYHPLQHLLRLDSEIIDVLIYSLGDIYNSGNNFAEQLLVIEAFQHPENWPVFQYALSGYADGEYIFNLIRGLEMNFLGLNLGITPSFTNPSLELIIILISGFAALSFCLVQNHISPGALSQGTRTNLGLLLFTVVLSLYFAFALPVGVGLYWTTGNFAAIGVVLLLNLLYPPKKLAVDALAYLKSMRKSPEQIREEKRRNTELRARENSDIAQFKSAKKQLVFYSISSGQYKFYKNTIDYLLENSKIIIHYLTNDPDDSIFNQKHPCLIPYYASQQRTISLMLKLDTEILVTTVPDLQSFHMKRSVVRDDIEYIHTFHSINSTHLTYREKAFDRFDTLFCVGPHQVEEIRRREAMANLPKKRLLKVGYGLYDQLVESYNSNNVNNNPRILIAPSWQADNILDICIEPLLESIANQKYDIVVRPHPQYIRLFPAQIESLKERFSKINKSIVFELDFSGNESIFKSDIVITDWSNIGYEFAYCTLKPCIFINTPMKVMNPNYERYGIQPIDISLRDSVGVSVDIEKVETINETIDYLLQNKDSYKNKIEETVKQYIYHPLRSGEASGIYLIKQLEKINGG
ncbi:MAG: YidC/Oxa1 family membrane protein insertase [Defluviitaleaceae bacterium]|nr:YidC/Oxa1 family membrane protein insertase [Defluviitaleaceae bacterium]